jgi:hypothetical protein
MRFDVVRTQSQMSKHIQILCTQVCVPRSNQVMAPILIHCGRYWPDHVLCENHTYAHPLKWRGKNVVSDLNPQHVRLQKVSIHVATCMNSHNMHDSHRPKIKPTWNPSWTFLTCQSRSCKAIHDHVCMCMGPFRTNGSIFMLHPSRWRQYKLSKRR